MGFIERIINIAHNKNGNIERQTRFLSPFTSNAFKSKSLKEDTYQPSGLVDKQGLLPKNYQDSSKLSGTVFDEHLALYEPEKFIASYANTAVLSKALDSNPEIRRILEENNLPVKIDTNNVLSIAKSHLLPTTKKAQEIYKNLGHSQNEKSYVYLTQAALLHDIGKAFIPSSILNKRGFLTPRERRIVELHNKLSYEVLRTTNLSPKVAQYALEHHNYDGKVKQTPENQALTISDIYCALREERPYKRSLNDLAAKTILCDMGANGKFDSSYILYM